MNILFVSSSGPRGSESLLEAGCHHLIDKLQQGHPDAHASEIIEARRALIAELQQRRSAAAVAA